MMDFDPVYPVNVTVRDLSLSIKPKKRFYGVKESAMTEKPILQNVSLDVPAGSLMAILGESGSGKVITFSEILTDQTSLLNLMAHRMSDKRLKVEGQIDFNGGPLEDIQHSYVIQQDVLRCTFSSKNN
jgi:ABC-type multidrug transport system ATPase subunit